MSTNVRKLCFLVIFDTCDVLYNWSISLLPPIVLNNLFGVVHGESTLHGEPTPYVFQSFQVQHNFSPQN